MIYEMEALATTLKQTRERKGLSQRQLSALSGVPQSHISKIEKAGVDLRISSLSAVANALDLELTLVPKNALPAVKSISRTTAPTPVATREVANAMKQIAEQVKAVQNLHIDPNAIEGITRAFRDLKQIENLILNSEQLQQVREAMKTTKGSGALESVQEAMRTIAQVRNQIAHNAPMLADAEYFKPKYQLEQDDDG